MPCLNVHFALHNIRCKHINSLNGSGGFQLTASLKDFAGGQLTASLKDFAGYQLTATL